MFRRKYMDTKRLGKPNIIVHDPNSSVEHKTLVNDICLWLYKHKFTFYTRAYTKLGEIVDIVVPELPKPFIEIRHSEKDKVKEYCSEYNMLRMFVDTADPYNLL